MAHCYETRDFIGSCENRGKMEVFRNDTICKAKKSTSSFTFLPEINISTPFFRFKVPIDLLDVLELFFNENDLLEAQKIEKICLFLKRSLRWRSEVIE